MQDLSLHNPGIQTAEGRVLAVSVPFIRAFDEKYSSPSLGVIWGLVDKTIH